MQPRGVGPLKIRSWKLPLQPILAWPFFLVFANLLAASPLVECDGATQRIILRDAGSNLVVHLNYHERCQITQVLVKGRPVLREAGVCSALQVNGKWFSTRDTIPAPQVKVQGNKLDLRGIHFGPADLKVEETWHFVAEENGIRWQIERIYPREAKIDDSAMPAWEFSDRSTWTGALLGNGGVAWVKLFDHPRSSYGVHTGKVFLWNKDTSDGLRILGDPLHKDKIAVRFSRELDEGFSLSYSATERDLVPKHGLSRFRRDTDEIWAPFTASARQVTVQYTIQALDYNQACDRGNFAGLPGRAIREICHTIARIGAVDEGIMGSNGYYSDVAVLHEPWLAQMGLAIDDPDYFRALDDTLDFQRRNAIAADGRVKPRWAGQRGDEIAGSYDARGYYECQWGWLMDSQTSWVINVAEQFDFNGDRSWLRRQKQTCEAVLEYLLRCDTDSNGLIKMKTGSHLESKGSDWIDVVWAAYENALVNAQAFWALSRWAECEDLLGDALHSERYRSLAARLKQRFNRSTNAGGFWDEINQCYAYWRNQDGSVHGTNLVVPVQFSAIGYGLCDDPNRRRAILDRFEQLMADEHLFFWPLCFYSYQKEEVHPKVNWPFPSYENGDLFLAWGELGTRSYAQYKPEVALKYVNKVLEQYGKDGLAFQRYLRSSQMGRGNDILANNSSIIVGLYRNVYGVQPKFNRLYLEPHLTPELNGTRLKYWLRGKWYQIDLALDACAIGVDRFVVTAPAPFALGLEQRGLQVYDANQARTLAVSVSSSKKFELKIQAWPPNPYDTRRWAESCEQAGAVSKHSVQGLLPNTAYRLFVNEEVRNLKSGPFGQLHFRVRLPAFTAQSFRLEFAPSP